MNSRDLALSQKRKFLPYIFSMIFPLIKMHSFDRSIEIMDQWYEVFFHFPYWFVSKDYFFWDYLIYFYKCFLQCDRDYGICLRYAVDCDAVYSVTHVWWLPKMVFYVHFYVVHCDRYLLSITVAIVCTLVKHRSQAFRVMFFFSIRIAIRLFWLSTEWAIQ